MVNRAHVYNRIDLERWSPEIGGTLLPAFSPDEAVGMLGILKSRVQGDTAFIHQRGVFCLLEEYTAAC